MKKILLLFSILYLTTSYSQGKKYFDAPFGGGGGFIPGWIIPDLNPLNEQLKKLNVPELSTSGIFTTGGGGFIYVNFIRNLRLGGMGFGGSTSETGRIQSGGTFYNFETIYSISGGGFTIEYSIPLISDIGISVGALLGGGSISIETFRSTGAFNWDDIWNENISEASSNISRRFENNYWILSPTLNIDIPLYRFVSFRIGTGYQLTLGEDWEIDNDQSLQNVPSDLNGRSFFINSGLFIGFFSY